MIFSELSQSFFFPKYNTKGQMSAEVAVLQEDNSQYHYCAVEHVMWGKLSSL